MIPISSFDPAGFKLASSYLPVSPQACGLSNTATWPTTPTISGSAASITSISDKHSLYGRYYIYDYPRGGSLRRRPTPLTTGTSGNKEPCGDVDPRRHLYASARPR